MALPKEYTREAPVFALVSQYTVGRINQYPSVRVTFDEVVYLPEMTVIVDEALDANADNLFEKLRIAAWADQEELVGRELCLKNSTYLGKIVTAEKVTPPEDDPYLEITLDNGFALDLSGEEIVLIAKMPVGTNAYRRARAGLRWELYLDGSNPMAMTRMTTMLGRVYFKALKAGLMQLGINSVSDAQILMAVQALAAQGINIDGLLAQEGEQLELDRAAGEPTGVLAFGDAP
jgi:hypothetical protein